MESLPRPSSYFTAWWHWITKISRELLYLPVFQLDFVHTVDFNNLSNAIKMLMQNIRGSAFTCMQMKLWGLGFRLRFGMNWRWKKRKEKKRKNKTNKQKRKNNNIIIIIIKFIIIIVIIIIIIIIIIINNNNNNNKTALKMLFQPDEKS